MLARLGAVIAEITDVIKSDFILELGVGDFFVNFFLDCRVKINAVFILDFKQPSHMVDACDKLFSALKLILHADFIEQGFGTALNAVAKTDGLDARVSCHVAGEHCHGVGIVKEECIGANLLHIVGKILHNGNGSESTHDTADAESVADSLPETVFFRNLKVNYRAGVIKTDLNCVNDKIRIFQSSLAVFNSEIALDFAVATLCGSHCFKNNSALLKPFAVNIVKCKNAVPERFNAHAVADNITGKNRAACTHESQFHNNSPEINILLFYPELSSVKLQTHYIINISEMQ